MQVLVKFFCTFSLIITFNLDSGIHGKPVEEGEEFNDMIASGMKTIEKDAAVDLPRNEFAELLQKGQFFQDIFAEQPTPDKIQFGHVCENPQEWEQRFEEKDLRNNRHQGKVRWGNTKGGYGEHYWDLNHGGAINGEEGKDQ